MFEFAKKLAITLSLLAISSGQFVAFGSNNAEEADNQLVLVRTMKSENTTTDITTMNQVPIDVWKMIFKMASTDTRPVDLQNVCIYWRNILREYAVPVIGLNYDILNPFMKLCTDVWKANEGIRGFKNGFLRYDATWYGGVQIVKGKVIDLKFSDLADPFCGTFDLSKCDDKSKFVRITTSVEEFFKVGGENEKRLVVLISPFQIVEQAIKSNPDLPFADILATWDKSKAPVGLFWRWGDWANPNWLDYLTNQTLSALSNRSNKVIRLYDLWGKTDPCRCGITGIRCEFHVDDGAWRHMLKFSCHFDK